MLDEEDCFEYHNDEDEFLSFRQQRMILGIVDSEEAAELRLEMQAEEEEALRSEEEWDPDWDTVRDVAKCILEHDRCRVAKALGMGWGGDAFDEPAKNTAFQWFEDGTWRLFDNR